ncbi:transcription factor E2F7-like [Mustelus asterias]
MNCLKLEDLVSSRIGKYEAPSQPLNDGKKAAQKENLCMEPRRTPPKTPVKPQATPSLVSWRKACSLNRVQVTPVKLGDKSSPEAWSPTANLRMLISAASPDIRDREKKKELFRQIENENIGNSNHVIQISEIADGATDDLEQQRPNRKQKSLGLLCQKFLARYPNYPISTEKTEISLDEVAAELGVERRRIYDIVNVLESLQLVSRLAKNQYSWHGLRGLQQTLAMLKKRAEQQKYAEQLTHIRHKVLDFHGEGMEKRESARKTWSSCPELSGETKCVESENKSASVNSRKDKSLRIMSEKFVMLFLVSDPNTVALDVAAKILIEESHQDSADNSKFKTKIRRLYDIANVLTSLGLIKKVHVTEERGRKPAFKWVGPANRNQSGDIPSHSIALFASGGSAETEFPVNTKERLESVPLIQSSRANLCSPAKFRKVRTIEAQDCCNKMVHLAAACRLQLEEDQKSSESLRNREDHQLNPVPSACPLLITGTAGTVESPVIPRQHYAFSVPQSEPSLPFGLPNAATEQLTSGPPPAASNTDKGHACPLKKQPIVYLQSLSTAPLLLLYRNRESSAEHATGSSEVQPSPHEEDSSLERSEMEAASSTRPSQKRSPSEQCALPGGPGHDDKPEAKRGKIHCCIEHTSVLSSSSVEQKTSTQHTVVLRNHTKCLNRISEAAVCPPTGSISVNVENHCPSTQTQDDDCHKDPRYTEGQNQIGTVEKEKTLVSAGNLISSPFVIQGSSGFTENNQRCCLAASPGLSELNLFISTNQSLSGMAIPPGLASVNLPYQLMVPVICQPIPPTQSAGNSLHNSALVHFNLQNLNLVPSGQLLMAPGSVPTPTRASVRASSPGQIHSPVLTPASCEDLPTKTESPVQQPVTIKLQEQSLILNTHKDGQQSFVQSYFHTPVPTVQGKKMEGLLVKVSSPAQRRLEIENNVTK